MNNIDLNQCLECAEVIDEIIFLSIGTSMASYRIIKKVQIKDCFKTTMTPRLTDLPMTTSLFKYLIGKKEVSRK